MSQRSGAEALSARTWIKTHRWRLARRTSQLGILLLFLLGPLAGVWIVKGNLSFSYTLNLLPLTDPFVALQSLLARHQPEPKALLGAAIVLVFYALVGGRVFCAWVCPMNPVSDAAAWLRDRLGIKGGAHVSRQTRYWILALALLLAALTGTLAWELVNPVSLLHRGLIFGLGATWALVLAIFLFDLFVMKDGWCGHLCPTGAFYSLVGRFSLLRVRAARRNACNDCLDCFAVCPEAQVIRPALKAIDGAGLTILSGNCSNCGRCVEVCGKDVFEFGLRGAGTTKPVLPGAPKVSPATGKSH